MYASTKYGGILLCGWDEPAFFMTLYNVDPSFWIYPPPTSQSWYPLSPHDSLTRASWLCDGISASNSVWVSSPPVSFNVVCVPPYPSINLPDKFGVLFCPLHKAHPDGILFTVPDHAHMMPDGIPDDPAKANSFLRAKTFVFPTMNFRTHHKQLYRFMVWSKSCAFACPPKSYYL